MISNVIFFHNEAVLVIVFSVLFWLPDLDLCLISNEPSICSRVIPWALLFESTRFRLSTPLGISLSPSMKRFSKLMTSSVCSTCQSFLLEDFSDRMSCLQSVFFYRNNADFPYIRQNQETFLGVSTKISLKKVSKSQNFENFGIKSQSFSKV